MKSGDLAGRKSSAAAMPLSRGLCRTARDTDTCQGVGLGDKVESSQTVSINKRSVSLSQCGRVAQKRPSQVTLVTLFSFSRENRIKYIKERDPKFESSSTHCESSLKEPISL